jgi:predicted dehydrogenase
VAIIGCGLIGQKRAKALGPARLVACADMVMDRARNLAQTNPGCTPYGDWREAVKHFGVDIVIVATLHDSLAEIAAGAVEAGRHVLIEKPAARRAAELARLPALAASHRVLVRTGFNHRYHRAMRKARELVDADALGDLMFLRARYGHGGRPGYDREWRANPLLSGGGELIDQGPHLIDLARWFLGDFVSVEGFAHTFFWDMPVDDNAFMLLRTAQNRVAFMHASCTEWKNMFSLELYGRTGKIEVSGLGGSYGTERITHYRMLPKMGPPETQAWEYPMADDSWDVEMNAFLDDVSRGRKPEPGIEDAIAVLQVVERLYEISGYDHHTKPAEN